MAQVRTNLKNVLPIFPEFLSPQYLGFDLPLGRQLVPLHREAHPRQPGRQDRELQHADRARAVHRTGFNGLAIRLPGMVGQTRLSAMSWTRSYKNVFSVDLRYAEF